jgi:fatty acid desaturase
MPATNSAALSDYRLVGKNSELAIATGLAEATWYTSPYPERCRIVDPPRLAAVRDTILWFALIIGSGWAGFMLWQAGSWWAAVPFMIYGVLYASTSDSRWHESGHGTAFKTDWMNNALYEIASFMVMRESVVWRWSHTRHHSDTIIVGRDPEIAVPRPPNIASLVLNFFALPVIPKYFRSVVLHSAGQMTPDEKTFIPESEYEKVIFRARIYLLIYAGVVGLAIWQRSLLPLMFIGLPTLYGSWLMPIYGYTQHAGLAENVLDHRLNCRTVYLNFVHRYLYWNMNYHTEHHMFPLVPYHNLPKLHEIVKPDMPSPYNGLWRAWREIIPAVWRQVKEPTFFVPRILPTPTLPAEAPSTPRIFTAKGRALNGWG